MGYGLRRAVYGLGFRVVVQDLGCARFRASMATQNNLFHMPSFRLPDADGKARGQNPTSMWACKRVVPSR